MTSPDRPEVPTSTADMLERTRRRAGQIRRRRRAGAVTAVVVALAAAVAVPLALTAGHRSSHTVQVVAPPSTRPAPTTVLVPTTGSSTTVAPTTAAPTTAAPTTATTAFPPTTGSTVPTTTTPPVPTTSGAEVAACATGGLHASLAHRGAAAGSSVYDLVLTNVGSVTCTVAGYPGVSYVTGAAGTIVGAPAQRDASSPAVTVALAPGQAALSTLTEADAYNYPPTSCRLTAVTGLRVYPPDQTAALFVAQPTQACANAADGDLQIAPARSASSTGD
jgi:Protein of unknown function (DUF4232)